MTGLFAADVVVEETEPLDPLLDSFDSPMIGYPIGTRFVVRRDRPHPGAQLSLF